MSGVIVAFAASVPAGIALGVVSAACARGAVRPCRAVRQHRAIALWGGGCVALAGGATLAAASTYVDYQRMLLAATCGAIVLMFAVVAWILLVETDDGDPAASDDEPAWWPTFEREFDEWARRSRIPSGSAR